MKSYKHSSADVQSCKIGNGTKIWQFVVILSGAKIGTDCNICSHCLIENDVIIGDRVTVKSGVQLWDGVRLEDDVFLGPNVTFTNDLFPRSKQYPEKFFQTVVEKGASVGANATLLAGIHVGKYAMIGAGAVVTKDVPSNAIVVGNPARITGYVDTKSKSDGKLEPPMESKVGCFNSKVRGVGLYTLPVIKDMRGSLSFAEIGQYLPFDPQRYFLVYDVKSHEIRGEHAHRHIHQFLVCVSGSCSVVVDDGESRQEFDLKHPGMAIHIPPMVWGIQYKYSKEAVLMVLASGKYAAEEYIRDYDEFLALVKS